MDEEQLFKFKERLMGNILFVGELNRRNLLSENILISVFDMLLAVNSDSQANFVNDDTVEGACILMNKLGHIIDDKINKFNAMPADKKAKNEGKVTEYNKIFERFEELSEAEKAPISKRVQLLIKNMIDNRSSGWEKTKKMNESGPKKVEDLRRELEAKAREEEEQRMIAEQDE